MIREPFPRTALHEDDPRAWTTDEEFALLGSEAGAAAVEELIGKLVGARREAKATRRPRSVAWGADTTARVRG